MSGFRRDLRYAGRQLRQHPGFTVAAVLTLGLAIGLNSAVFSAVNALLFRPLPVSEPEQLMAVYSSEPGDFMARSPLSAVDVEELTGGTSAFSQVLAYTYTPLAVEHGDDSRLVLGVRATRDVFAVLGVEAALGRTFDEAAEPGQGAPAAPDEVVLSHRAWRRWFSADPEIVGSTLRVGGRSATVVGVAPEDFHGLTRGVAPELWRPLPTPLASPDRREDRELRRLWVVGRLADGAARATANAELKALSARLARDYPDTHRRREFVALPADSVRILPGVDATLATASAVVLALVGLVLLIASANVGHLLLARAAGRRREIATRLALGAGPGAIGRQLLTESLLLAALGGGAGLLLALGSNVALGTLRLPLPVEPVLGLAIDGRVLLYTLATSLAAALAFGLAPALAAAREDLTAHLAAGSSGAGRQGGRLGGALVIGQVALSLLLLVAAGLMVRSLRGAHAVDPGFDPRGVAVVTFASRVPAAERAAFDRRLLERVRALPEVHSAALASHLPLTVEIRFARVAVLGEEPEDDWPSVDAALTGPGYFETLRVPVLRGRGFDERDDAGAQPVAVVNRSFAEQFAPGGEILGRRLRVAGEEHSLSVVGIVSDGKYRTLGETGRPFLYRPLAQGRGGAGRSGEITTGSETLAARTRGEPSAVLPELRRTLRELDPRVAVARLETLEETLGLALFLPRSAAALFGLFGLLGLPRGTWNRSVRPRAVDPRPRRQKATRRRTARRQRVSSSGLLRYVVGGGSCLFYDALRARLQTRTATGLRRLVAGQEKKEGAAPALTGRLDPDPAAVYLDDAPGQGQTDPRPLDARVQAVEQLHHLVLGQAPRPVGVVTMTGEGLGGRLEEQQAAAIGAEPQVAVRVFVDVPDAVVAVPVGPRRIVLVVGESVIARGRVGREAHQPVAGAEPQPAARVLVDREH